MRTQRWHRAAGHCQANFPIALRSACLLITATFALHVLTRDVHAERQPTFSLSYCCDRAALIAVGKLNPTNELAFDQALLGAAKTLKVARLDWNGGNRLRTAMGQDPDTTIEVLVFLAEKKVPVLGDAAVIGFKNEHVYLVDGSKGGLLGDGSPPVRQGSLTKRLLLERTRKAIALTARRRATLDERPSAIRAQKVLDILREDDKDRKQTPVPDMWPDYHVREIARAMAPLTREEENVVLHELSDTRDARWRIRLLRFAAEAPLSGEAFEIVGNWIGREHQQAIREAAIGALVRINNEWATELLLPLATLDDPCFATILTGLSAPSSNSDYYTRNIKTVELLIDLLPKVEGVPDRDPNADRLRTAVFSAMHANFHQRLLPLLTERTQPNHPSAWRAIPLLQNATGLQISREDTAALNAWRLRAHDTLNKEYNLKTPDGIDQWLTAYQSSDETTREMLHRLWLFEPTAPETYLLAQAESSNLGQMRSARAALSRLWQWDRLTPQAKSAIIDRYISVHLKELDSPHSATGGRELRVVARRKFPFPKDTWVQYSSDFSLDGRPPQLSASWGGRDMAGEGDFELGSMGGGQTWGEPSARAVVALQEFNHRTGKVVWTHRWNLGPLRLRRLEPRLSQTSAQ